MYMSYKRPSPKRKRGKRGKTGYAVAYEGQHQKGGMRGDRRSTSSVTYYEIHTSQLTGASLSICVGRTIPSEPGKYILFAEECVDFKTV